jgi:diguanylate cyclase (GGDEF)-like protein/PAS domain S-box-containing protein
LKNITTLEESCKVHAVDIKPKSKFIPDYQRFFQLSKDMLCVIGFDGRFKRVNPVFQEILGFSEEEVIEQDVTKFIHEDDRRGATSLLKTLYGTSVVLSFENRCITKHGLYKWLSWSVRSILSENVIYAVAREITEYKLMVDELRGVSLYDDMTQLYNRRGFFAAGENYLNRIPKEGLGLAMVYFELDCVPEINRLYGHPDGDRILIRFANMLKDYFRTSDLLARVGGDKFAIMGLVHNEQEIELLIERLNRMILNFNKNQPETHRLFMRIGMTYTETRTRITLADLLARAEANHLKKGHTFPLGKT